MREADRAVVDAVEADLFLFDFFWLFLMVVVSLGGRGKGVTNLLLLALPDVARANTLSTHLVAAVVDLDAGHGRAAGVAQRHDKCVHAVVDQPALAFDVLFLI